MRSILKEHSLKAQIAGVNQFSDAVLELVWRMKTQDVPMLFTWQQQHERYNRDMFTPYTRRGEVVVQTVWPAVLLHENGPVMCKGIVQLK